MIFRLAAGFNYAYESGVLKYHHAVGLVEMGITELAQLTVTSVSAGLSISLHLARTPIVEDEKCQDRFIEHVANFLSSLCSDVRKRVVSIGIHLSGSRYEGVGFLGGAEQFVTGRESEDRAARFLNEIGRVTSLPIWLENANMYSKASEDVLSAGQSAARIAGQAAAGVIVDLAHLVGDCNNIGLNPLVALGSIPWERVVELHLSGIRESADGTMHDGHGFPIHAKVWEMLPLILRLASASRYEQVWVNVEHTPPSWIQQQVAFDTDFSQVHSLISNPPISSLFRPNTRQYMVGYLKYVLRGQIPLIEPALVQRGLDLDSVLKNWLDQLSAQGQRVIFDREEVAPSELVKSKVLTHEFLGFAKEVMRSVEFANGA